MSEHDKAIKVAKLVRSQSKLYDSVPNALAAAVIDMAAEIERLREALEEYGRHDEENCPVGRSHPQHVGEPCTCGLDTALAEPEKAEQESP